MAFEDAFRDLVLEQLKVDSTTIQVARENPGRNNYGERNYDAAIIRALDQAKTPCSTPTLALWYCYRYLNMHFDQFTEVINLEVDSFKNLCKNLLLLAIKAYGTLLPERLKRCTMEASRTSLARA